jgi:hypothetical protein
MKKVKKLFVIATNHFVKRYKQRILKTEATLNRKSVVKHMTERLLDERQLNNLKIFQNTKQAVSLPVSKGHRIILRKRRLITII